MFCLCVVVQIIELSHVKKRYAMCIAHLQLAQITAKSGSSGVGVVSLGARAFVSPERSMSGAHAHAHSLSLSASGRRAQEHKHRGTHAAFSPSHPFRTAGWVQLSAKD